MMPVPLRQWMLELLDFVDEQLTTFWEPLPRDVDLSTATWLEGTSYQFWRKKELAELTTRYSNWLECLKFFIVNQHNKREDYPTYKYNRLINARSDEFKVFFGPLAKAIEKVIFTHPAFIKKVPVIDRPDYIMSHVYREDCTRYFATDYTSFEANFTPEIMKIVELRMMSYMISKFDEKSREMWGWVFENILAGVNVCENGLGYTTYVRGTRMSGEMTTSLCNGFSNLMFSMFVFKKAGCKSVSCVVEGDDGLFSIGPDDTPPTTEDFAKLGLKVKLEEHDQINTASFCGLLFDPVERTNITNPISAIINVPYLEPRLAGAKRTKRLAALKSKALSAKYQYNGCPIIDAYASYILKFTRHIDIRSYRSDDWWTNEIMALATEDTKKWKMPTEPGERTRMLVEEVYGISVTDQRILEEYFRSLEALEPWYHRLFHNHVPEENFTVAQIAAASIRPLDDVRIDVEGLPLPRNGRLVAEARRRLRVPEHLRSCFNTTACRNVGGVFRDDT